MHLTLRSWPLLLALGLSACASGAAPSSEGCAAIAGVLGRQMAASGLAWTGEPPGRAGMIVAARTANLHLMLSQEAATQLFECRSAEAGEVREDQLAGRTWRVTAAVRIARIRAQLREEIEAVLLVSERMAAADAAVVAGPAARAARAAPTNRAEARQEAELRILLSAHAARRESFGATMLLAGQFTDTDMGRDEPSR